MIKFCINKYDKFRVYTYFCSMATLEKVILGIDPGTNILGYGVIKLRGNKAKMEAMGVIDLRKCKDVYLKLGRIHERVLGIIGRSNQMKWLLRLPSLVKTCKVCSNLDAHKVWPLLLP